MSTSRRYRPLKGFVLLVDDPLESTKDGVVVRVGEAGWRTYMDYVVAEAGTETAFGAGDRVVLAHPNAGRSVTLDGAPYRIVRSSDILAVAE